MLHYKAQKYCQKIYRLFTKVSTLHPITLFNLVVPTLLSLVGGPLSGKRAWFTESHIAFISFSLVALFTQFILDKLNTLNHILLN